MDYLEKHNIYQLVDVIGSSVFYNRPENPTEFIIEQLQTIERLKQGTDENGQVSPLFNDKDIETLFSMFSKNMDTITAAQAITGIFFFFRYLSSFTYLLKKYFHFSLKLFRLLEFTQMNLLERHC